MTTLGRVIVTVLVIAVLVSLTVLAAHLLQTSEEKGKAGPPAAPPVAKTPASIAGPGPVAAAPKEGSAAEAGKTASAPPAKAPAEEPGKAAKPGEAAPPPPPPMSASPGDAKTEEAMAMVRDRPFEAQKRLSEALRAGLAGAQAGQVQEALRGLADKLQLSDRRAPDDTYSKAYEVASGDSLIAIGQRFLIPYELVMKLNRMSSTSIAAGQTLKLIQGPIHVEILKGRKDLQVWLDKVCLRVYPVAIGADNKTPEGTFVVKNKLKDPPYQPQHKPKSEFRASGAPDNPLGSRWIDIGNHYGIHGTIDPTSIGRDVSEGCIRMHNKDVEELYDMVVTGASKVIIRP